MMQFSIGIGIGIGIGNGNGDATASSAARAQSDALLRQATGDSRSDDDDKIAKAGRDFESILLGSWLQGAEKSFAAAPGGDGDEQDDGGGSQYMSLAMQQLAGSLSASGGIGIAKMITARLETAKKTPFSSEMQPSAANLSPE